jgi:hypothetical protein
MKPRKMKPPADLSPAEVFFFNHAGYSYRPPQTPRQGRIECAKALALAEKRAKEIGLVFTWEPECEPWDGDVPLAPTDLLEWCACFMPNEDCERYPNDYRKGHCLASLGMVATTGYDDPYRRVVEAELALEALDTLDREADERATIAANELASRATFAGPS